ncbi:hypothetical protein B0H13DRAFT_1930216 [Mycena leptocephala]|nr:hypothetical protein B0H13DRAFT_1930216 [Mycena leptocephala]
MSSFTGLAVLENPCLIPKTKTVVFDLQAYLPSSEPALIGSVQYFNRDNLEFPEIGCYAVWVSDRVARTLPTAEVYSQDLSPMDYHVLGDAVWVCGLASNIKDDATFDVVVEQYISVTESVIDVDQVVFLGQQPHSASVPKAEQVYLIALQQAKISNADGTIVDLENPLIRTKVRYTRKRSSHAVSGVPTAQLFRLLTVHSVNSASSSLLRHLLVFSAFPPI